MQKIITTVSLEDLEQDGYDISKVSENQMELIALDMEQSYLDGHYWVDLQQAVDKLGIKRD
tara:strand:+ start:2524 stop:2706 length:183 start_codon:yes stop_codon:yes gene_type:complete